MRREFVCVLGIGRIERDAGAQMQCEGVVVEALLV
jgi:hypothetical protein